MTSPATQAAPSRRQRPSASRIASNGLWSHVDTNSVPGVRLSAFPKAATVGINAGGRAGD